MKQNRTGRRARVLGSKASFGGNALPALPLGHAGRNCALPMQPKTQRPAAKQFDEFPGGEDIYEDK